MGNAIITSRSGSDSISAIGDIKFSFRTDLGEKYLLCNGDIIDEAIYPKLSEYIKNNQQPRDIYLERVVPYNQYNPIYTVDPNGSSIYEIYDYYDNTTSYIYLKEFKDFKKYIDSEYTGKRVIYNTSENASSILNRYSLVDCKFYNGKLYIAYSNINANCTYFAIYDPESVASSTMSLYLTKISNSNTLRLVDTGDNLLLIYTTINGNDIYCYKLTDEGIFEKGTGIHIYNSEDTLSISGVSVVNGYIILELQNNDNYDTLTLLYNSTDILSTWNTVNIISNHSNTPISSIVYFNNYYWYTCNGYENGFLVYRSQDLNTWSLYLTVLDGDVKISSTLLIRNSALILHSQDLYENINRSSIYDEESDSFKTLDIIIASSDYRIPIAYYASNYNIEENNDIYLYRKTGNIVTKEDCIVRTPIIQSSDNEYVYIKAKE